MPAPSSTRPLLRGPARALLLEALLAVALVLPTASASAASYRHEFATSFGAAASTPPNPYPLSDPSAVAVDNSTGPSQGDLYVTDPGNHRVEKFDSEGHFLLMFGKEVNKGAVERHGPEAEQNVCDAAEECQPGAAGSLPGAFETPAFIAVDSSSGPSSGDVYVGDTGDNSVSKFDSSGNLIASWGAAGRLSGSPAEAFGALAGIAVDDSGDLFVYGVDERMFRFEPTGQLGASFTTVPELGDFGPRSVAPRGIAVDSEGNLYKIDLPGAVAKLTETGGFPDVPDCSANWPCLLDSGPENATGLAIDPNTNDLYVDQGGASISHFAANCPLYFQSAPGHYYYACAPEDEFGTEAPSHLNAAQGLAYGAHSNDLYVADAGEGAVAVFSRYEPPSLSTEEPTDLEPTSLTLHGHVDPGSRGEVTSCVFEYGYTTSYGSSLPCSPATFTAPTSVQAALSGLIQGEHYHYRLAIENTSGESLHTPDEVLAPAEPPTIESVTATELTPTSARVSASINPHGRLTSYLLEYGLTASYGEATTETVIGAGAGPVPVEIDLHNLQPRSTYHFRLLAHSTEGATATEDHSFDFYPAPCPNEALREQSGSGSLPDCRAYELVSPGNTGSTILFPSDGPSSGDATSPSRLAYTGAFGAIAGVGDPINTLGDIYVSTRTGTGWITKYVGLPANQAFLMGGPEGIEDEPDKSEQGVLANQSLSELLDWKIGESGVFDFSPTSLAPYVWDTSTGQLLGRWPTNLESVTEGEAFSGSLATSAGLTHFAFSSDLDFVRGAPSGAVYDNNTLAKTISVVSFTGAGTNLRGALPLKLSANGSHILMAKGGLCSGRQHNQPPCPPAQLYMRVNDAATYEIAPTHQVSFVGMTVDGSRVFFTSPEQLLPEDEDESVDLYMWSAEKAEHQEQPLTLISAGEAGAGNSDSCEAAWTEKCDVQPINFTTYARLQGGAGGNGVSDSSIASESGDIYFYSPQQLLGDRGVPNLENLYLYRAGELHLVTALSPAPVCTLDQGEPICSAGPVARMDVSPDGAHMAFITNSQVTPYENAGHSEMYSYEPDTGRITCDSCVPDGEPPSGDVYVNDTYASQNGLFMANDGRVFFSTEQSLVPQDTNHAEDVYEYVDGRPQLITTGTGAGLLSTLEGLIAAEAFPGLIGVSADGADAYFSTFSQLVAQDENGEILKIYDARTDGGFPVAEAPPHCPSAEECHGPGSVSPSSPLQGTATDLGATGNATPNSHPKHHKKKHKRKTKRHHHRAAHHDRGGKK